MSYSNLSRRSLIQGCWATAAALIGVPAVLPAVAAGYPEIIAYRNPGCGCCEKWAAHLREAEFAVTMQDDLELDRRRQNAGVPAGLAGCHTAFMGDYIVEGHVPAQDIVRFLSEKPDARGLAVPGMPMGSPGMESGDAKEAYEVFVFKADGTWSVYARHG